MNKIDKIYTCKNKYKTFYLKSIRATNDNYTRIFANKRAAIL